jgi:Putative peptidoglycan binding domain
MRMVSDYRLKQGAANLRKYADVFARAEVEYGVPPARGYDVGNIDGILGSGTRYAVRKEQIRLGLPVDCWPTAELLAKLAA